MFARGHWFVNLDAVVIYLLFEYFLLSYFIQHDETKNPDFFLMETMIMYSHFQNTMPILVLITGKL
jgi:hypothetical protein